jgi:hypothetical protein
MRILLTAEILLLESALGQSLAAKNHPQFLARNALIERCTSMPPNSVSAPDRLVKRRTALSPSAWHRRIGSPLLIAAVALLAVARLHAVEVTTSSGTSFNTIAPNSAKIPNWTTGWARCGLTAWSYVGKVNDASGVYLGNGWAITAAHVGNGDLILGSNTYSLIRGTDHQLVNSDGSSADLVVFKLAQAPNLPALTILPTDPIPFSASQPGDKAAMIGYGGGQGETWGYNTVTAVNSLAQVGTNTSNDLETALGTVTAGASSITNKAFFVGGDSGGGDFIFNTSTQTWMLAGLNEAIDGNNDSFMVQLDTYASQIDAITGLTAPSELPGSKGSSGLAGVPEPSAEGLLGLGLMLSAWNVRRRPRCASSLIQSTGT